jgi:hypothetical protein
MTHMEVGRAQAWLFQLFSNARALVWLNPELVKFSIPQKPEPKV